MAVARTRAQGEYAKNMYRCPTEWQQLVEVRRARAASAQHERAEREFLPERLRGRLHVVEPRIDLKA